MQWLKQKKLRLETPFVLISVCAFSGKIPSFVAARLTARYWVPYLLRFATIRHFSRLFATICTIRDYSHYSLFAIRYSGLFAVRYSRLFAIRDYSLFGFSRNPFKTKFLNFGWPLNGGKDNRETLTGTTKWWPRPPYRGNWSIGVLFIVFY